MDKFGQVIRKAKDELIAIKNEMGKIGLRKQDEIKLDDTVTVYNFVQRGRHYLQLLRKFAFLYF